MMAKQRGSVKNVTDQQSNPILQMRVVDNDNGTTSIGDVNKD